MSEFLLALFGYPAAIYTGLLGIAVVYWLFVIAGAVDIDLFGSGAEGALEGATEGAIEGAAEGALEGAAEGAIEGAAEGAIEGVAEGAIEGVAEGAMDGVADGVADGIADGVADGIAEGSGEAIAEAGGESALAYVIGALKLRRAPVTVVYSVFALTGWALCMAGSLTIEALLGSLLPTWILGTTLLVLSVPVALMTTSVAIKPLAPLFVHATTHGHHHLVGESCIIATGRADTEFGQAYVERGTGSLLIQVRAQADTVLQKRDQALIIEYHPQNEVYIVEPMQNLLGDGK